MKKLIILLVVILSGMAIAVQAQIDTVYKITNFGKPTQITYIGIINGQDTVWVEKGKGSSQGFKEQTDTLEVIQELQNIQKLYEETYKGKVKNLETTDADLIRLQGIIIYLNSKLEALRKQK